MENITPPWVFSSNSFKFIPIPHWDQRRAVHNSALNKSDGQIIWEAKAPQVALEQVHNQQSCHATPLVEKTDCMFRFLWSTLLQPQWKITLKKPLPVPKSLYGTATSPISHEDSSLSVVDNDKNLEASRLSKSKIYAFNKTDGSLAWETPRPLHRSGWSTPMIWRITESKNWLFLVTDVFAGMNPRRTREMACDWLLTRNNSATNSWRRQNLCHIC